MFRDWLTQHFAIGAVVFLFGWVLWRFVHIFQKPNHHHSFVYQRSITYRHERNYGKDEDVLDTATTTTMEETGT